VIIFLNLISSLADLTTFTKVKCWILTLEERGKCDYTKVVKLVMIEVAV